MAFAVLEKGEVGVEVTFVQKNPLANLDAHVVGTGLEPNATYKLTVREGWDVSSNCEFQGEVWDPNEVSVSPIEIAEGIASPREAGRSRFRAKPFHELRESFAAKRLGERRSGSSTSESAIESCDSESLETDIDTATDRSRSSVRLRESKASRK